MACILYFHRYFNHIPEMSHTPINFMPQIIANNRRGTDQIGTKRHAFCTCIKTQKRTRTVCLCFASRRQGHSGWATRLAQNGVCTSARGKHAHVLQAAQTFQAIAHCITDAKPSRGYDTQGYETQAKHRQNQAHDMLKILKLLYPFRTCGTALWRKATSMVPCLSAPWILNQAVRNKACLGRPKTSVHESLALPLPCAQIQRAPQLQLRARFQAAGQHTRTPRFPETTSNPKLCAAVLAHIFFSSGLLCMHLTLVRRPGRGTLPAPRNAGTLCERPGADAP